MLYTVGPQVHSSLVDPGSRADVQLMSHLHLSTVLATQETNVARLCSMPTKLKGCIGSTKLEAKLARVLEPQKLDLGCALFGKRKITYSFFFFFIKI